tara:strand:- start:5285 stop:7408 length:2124 start_codon:yes stop_codon:yes gene_type:complete
MNNPPIIKPKILNMATKFAKSPAGKVVGLSPMGRAAMGILGLGAVGPSVINAMDNAEERSANLPKDVVLAGGETDAIIPDSQPLEIQDRLNNLTKSIAALSGQEKKKKPKEVKKDELAEFDDAKEFKKWIKKNTRKDKKTGGLLFQPLGGAEVAIDNTPETNVLLYEVFKEQTGRTGEAADAIVNMDTESLSELQQDPFTYTSKADFADTLKLLRGQDLPPEKASSFQNIARGVGQVAGTGLGLLTPVGKVNKVLKPFAKAIPATLGYMGGDKAAKFLTGYPDEEGTTSGQTPRAEEYAEAVAGTMPIDYFDPGGTDTRYQATKNLARMEYEDQQAANTQQLAFRKSGTNDPYELTPVPITPFEIQEMSKAGYEFGPAQFADEVFTREAILAGRDLSGPSQAEIREAELNNQLTLSKIAKNYAALEEGETGSPLTFKKAFKIELPGMYSTASNERLKYDVRLLENEEGDSKFKADLNIAPILSEIYKAENYSQQTQDELNEVKNLIGPDTVGLGQRTNEVIKGINALSGETRRRDIDIKFEVNSETGEVATDEYGQPILTEESKEIAAEVLSRWAKRFTAQNITTLLGESNRTISDADRKRADDIVNVLGTFSDITSVYIALDQLIKIFETPSKNANVALQALYAQGEQSGYLDEILKAEENLTSEMKRGGTEFATPKSSRLQFQEVSQSDIPKDKIVRTIDLIGGS